ncbi:MAG: MFS transporter [Anaerolineae bacterium]|nr:MFS transporter [Anaerolineae bacterium]
MFSHLTRLAWLIVGAHLVIELCNNFLPVVFPLFITTIGLTYTQVGIVTLVAGTCGTLTQPFFGYLSDRWGSRQLTVFSLAWIGLTMGLVGFAWNYPSLVLLAALGALGSAAFHPAGATIALTDGKREKRGTSVSVFSVGGNLGTALSPLWITLGLTWLGIQGTVILIPVALLFSLFLYRQLIPKTSSAQAQPSPWPAQSQPNRPQKIENGALLGLILVVMAVMSRTWFQITLVTYLPEWLRSEGHTLAYGGQMLSVMLVFIGVGSLTGGTLSDRIGRWQVLALSLLLLAPVHWLFLSTTGAGQMALAGVMGVLLGASFPVGLVMAQDAWPSRVGMATALVMGLGWATGGIGASVTGFLADQFSLTTGLLSLVLTPLVGVLCTLAYVVVQKNHVKNWADPITASAPETVKFSKQSAGDEIL